MEMGNKYWKLIILLIRISLKKERVVENYTWIEDAHPPFDLFIKIKCENQVEPFKNSLFFLAEIIVPIIEY